MVAQPNRLRMSVENYFMLYNNSVDARYEFIDGYAYMMAGGTANHSTISINITSLLSNLLGSGPCRTYNSDMRVRLSESRYVFPDASVSCAESDRGNIEVIHSPRLVIEVLSPSTEAYDRGNKFSYYRACPTIEEYVLVNTQQKTIEVYRRARPNLWTLHVFEPEQQIELASLGISFPIAAVYRNVIMPKEDLDLPPV